jgi:hypothetical protein
MLATLKTRKMIDRVTDARNRTIPFIPPPPVDLPQKTCLDIHRKAKGGTFSVGFGIFA